MPGHVGAAVEAPTTQSTAYRARVLLSRQPRHSHTNGDALKTFFFILYKQFIFCQTVVDLIRYILSGEFA